MLRSTWVALALVAAAAVTGCAGERTDTPTPKATVVVADDAFHPRTVRIRAGERVTWVNRNVPMVTVQTEGTGFFEYDREKLRAQGRFDLHVLSPGEAESVTFDRPGRYEYFSTFDLSMRGAVIVELPPR